MEAGITDLRMESKENSGTDRTERKHELYKSLLFGLGAFMFVFTLMRLFWELTTRR